jgi:predicted nucleotidyltransferase
MKDLKQSTKQRFTAFDFDYPEPALEAQIVAHETGVDEATAAQLLKVAQAARKLKGHGLDEGISTRLIVYAATLIRQGVAPTDACRMAMVRPITDDADIRATLDHAIDAKWLAMRGFPGSALPCTGWMRYLARRAIIGNATLSLFLVLTPMPMPTRLLLPQDAIRDFCRAHAVRELAVFGSAVRDDFRGDSDVDVLIDLAPDARVGLIGLQRMRDELSALIGRPVDLLTRSSLNRHIRDEVLREARIIHAE